MIDIDISLSRVTRVSASLTCPCVIGLLSRCVSHQTNSMFYTHIFRSIARRDLKSYCYKLYHLYK